MSEGSATKNYETFLNNEYYVKGPTQRLLAKMAGGLAPHTISRWLSSNNIEPIKKDIEKAGKNLRYPIDSTRALLRDLVFKKVRVVKKVLNFYNFKGGTGKTSICFQVASHLSLMGFDILVVDADPQGHLSSSFGFDTSKSYATLYDVIEGSCSLEDAIIPIYPGLSCLPSNISLTKLEILLNELPKREERIKIDLSRALKNYDFIIFDTNPTISHLNRNILVFSDLINIVCETQPYSLNGLKLLWEDMNKFFPRMMIPIPDILLIPNKYEDRSATCAEGMTILRQYYHDYMITNFAIRKSEDINVSAKMCMPLAFFARANSIAFEDIIDLTHYIIQKTTEEKDTLNEKN